MSSSTSNSEFRGPRRRRSFWRVRVWLPTIVGAVVLATALAASRHYLPVKPIPGPLLSCIISDRAYEFQRRRPWPYRISMYFADVIALGESRVMADVAPPAFEEVLGLRVVNCAAPTGYGGQIDRLLESIKTYPPKKLILTLSPIGLYNNGDAPPDPVSTWVLSRHVFDHTLDLAGNRLVSRVVPQVRVPVGTDFQVSPFFFAPLQGWDPMFPTALSPMASDKGYTWAMGVNIKERARAAEKLVPLIDKLRKKGWQIACVRLPVSPTLFAIENSTYPAEDFATWCKKHNLVFLDYSRAAYNTQDGSHLPGPEAMRFSYQLAKDLHEHCGW